MNKRWEPRVKPTYRWQNRGKRTWGTTDQHLLAEIRDLLIAILNEQDDIGIKNAIVTLTRRLASQQAAMEQLTAALEHTALRGEDSSPTTGALSSK